MMTKHPTICGPVVANESGGTASPRLTIGGNPNVLTRGIFFLFDESLNSFETTPGGGHRNTPIKVRETARWTRFMMLVLP